MDEAGESDDGPRHALLIAIAPSAKTSHEAQECRILVGRDRGPEPELGCRGDRDLRYLLADVFDVTSRVGGSKLFGLIQSAEHNIFGLFVGKRTILTDNLRRSHLEGSEAYVCETQGLRERRGSR